MNDPTMSHLAAEEIELWAQGLLPAAPAIHLAACSLCRAEAERERKVMLDLVQLQKFAPSPGFADRVMGRVRISTPSGGFGVER